MKKTKSGFTIVELLIVIVVIGVLATITIVAYNGLQNRAANNSRASTVGAYAKALSLYAAEYGVYPGVTTGYVSCFDGNVACWSGADQTLSTTLNTELKKVAGSVPSLSESGFTYTSTNGYYIIYRLADGSSCPDIGGTTQGPNNVTGGIRQCRMILPNPS